MKRWISCLLTAAMVFSFAAQCPLITAKAAEPSSSSSDALAALGIDASVAPEGYDPDSLDNPYGRDTIAVTPVYELYTIGWDSKVDDALEGTCTTQPSKAMENGTQFTAGSTYLDNVYLKSHLYGHEKWSAKTSSSILSQGASFNTSLQGRVKAYGNYAIISSGTYDTAKAATETQPTTGYLTGATNISTEFSFSGTGERNVSYAMADVAAGKFKSDKKLDQNNNVIQGESALSGQIAMVYAGEYSKNGGLYLRFGDATTGQYGQPITLIPAGKEIGNPTLKLANEDGSASGRLAENFAENPYQLKNYLQVATGDWNGDGIDEVAVYIPEVGNSRIVVYALQKLSGDGADAYKDPGKWRVAWTYFLKEGDVVSNMVSLVSGDVDQDGIDDLACTWGYYYGPEQNVGSRAVVMFGGKDTNLLKRSQEFSLSYGTSNIVRASFAFGDLAGSGEETLILCGQSDADLKGGKDSRYVALYTWNGSGFVSSMAQNFVLFEKDNDGKYTWSAMSSDLREKDTSSPYYDHFFSLPLMAANTAIISRPIQGDTVKQGNSETQVHGSLLYFDSLIISYGDSGLSIDESWDTSSAYPGGSKKDYVEYSAAAGDLTGQTGAGTLFTMSQTLSEHPVKTAAYTVKGSHQEPVYRSEYYYKNWFCKLFKIKTWYKVVDHWETVQDESTVNVSYSGYTPSETYLTAVARSEKGEGGAHYSKKDQVNSSYALCLANTDNDSSYMNYAGKHYYTYTDPQVLAVLASPPYFADLLDRDDLSGNYAESTTSYSKSTGSGGGSTGSTTISVGAYVSYEQDIKIFGVTIASWEAEATITAGFTWETEHTSTLEQTVTYSATSGEDKVAFYSIPMEIYEYTSYVPDGNGGYDKVITAVNIPHEASVRLLSLDDYEAIAEDYSVLPSISGSVLTHTLGDPASYPSDPDSYGKNLVAKYTGDPASVGFTAAGGGSTITQEIAMSEEKQNAYIGFATVDTKLGAGAGGVKVGVVAGFEGGGGTVKISTSGSSFSGQLQDMPIEAQNYGYAMNWRIFCYQYKQGKVSFPVVSYAVTEVKRPASLPTDFQQNIAETTDEAITLTWTYDKPVSGFQLYRYYDFPDGSGSYRLKYVPFSTGTKNADGTYTFTYTDKGLSPYTEYLYQIQTESSYDPKVSIYSEPLSCRTKTEVGYPTITVGGLDENGNLPIYPDADGKATVIVKDPDNYKGLSYQWQKLSGSDWKDISGAKGTSYTISNASAADQGTYRCRVNAIYFHEQSQKEFSISAYSASFTTAYSKRTPSAVLTVKGEKPQSGTTTVGKLHAELELHSANRDNITAPTGYITFTITGTDYECSRVVDLVPSTTPKTFGTESKYYSTASLDLTDLADGAYTVTAYYSGDRVFKDLQHDTGEVAIIGNATGYRLTLKNPSGSSVTKFTYGESIYPTLSSVTPTTVGYVDVTEGVTYRIVTAGTDGTDTKDILVNNFTSANPALNVGVYTLQALVDGKVAAKAEITVSPRPVTVSVPSQDNITANEVTNHPPVLKGDGLTPEELTALNLTYKATNSAGNTVTLHNNMDPGNYTVTPCPSSTTPADLYQNYTVTYVSGTYTVIGLTYRLTVEAQEYTDKAGPRAVGTAGISTGGTAGDYSANTVVQLYAQPNDGYMVDHWTVKYGETAEQTLSGDPNNPNRLTITTEAAPTEVKVYFKVKPIRLTATTDKGGRVDCTDDENFTSGANVTSGAEFTFKAVPAEGYHFFGWQLGVEGTSTTYPAGTDNGDGTNSLNIKVGTNSIALKAVFQRDSYTLTLEGDITAHYLRQDPANPTGPQIETTIVSGASIPGDTKITAQPKTGYQAAEGAEFILNGEATGQSDSCTFYLTANSVLSLDTQRNRYSITAAADDDSHGSVSVLVDGQPAQGDALSAVEGGSVITFTAKAARGYHFHHWTVNEADDTESGDTLTVGALGQNMTVTANFATSDKYTATGIVSHDSRGTMLYTLYDIYGNVVDEAEREMSNPLTLYEGESILFKVKTNPGYMVEQWDCNGSATVSTAKTYPGGKITADSAAAPDDTITVTAYLVASSLYEVGYAAYEHGTLTAKADGEPFDSMTLVSGGSDLTFTAAPADGYMVDYWTVTQGKLGDTETTDHYQADDLDVVDPVLTLEGLRTHTTVRVHFTEKALNKVTLTADTGAAAITYVTPLTANDDGVRNSTSEQVRTSGTVELTLTPEAGYLPKGDLTQMISDQANGAQVAVAESGGTYTVTVRGLNSNLSLTMSELFAKTYSITLPDHVTANVSRAAEGDTVKLTVTPASKYALSTLTLSAGTLNETVSSSTLTYTFTMPAEDVTVSASFTYQGGGSSGGGGGGGGGGGSIAPTPEVKPGNSTVSNPNGDSIPAEVKVSGGTATVTVDQKKLADIAKDGNGLILDLSKEKGADSAAMDSQTFLALSQGAGSSLTVKLPGGSAALDQATLSALIRNVQDGDTVSITVAPQSHSDLTSAQRSIVPTSAAIAEVTLTVTSSDGTVRVIHDLGGTAEISLPYTLKSGETGERLTVYYLSDTGAAEKIPCTYDAAAKAVTFRTDHFSTFLVVHEYSKPFTDITLGSWYYDGVNNALANGWFSGVSATAFAPDSSMTRAMLVTVLYRMSGSPTVSGTSAFVDVSSGAWYAQAVAWAAENQLVAGYEDGTFRPDLAITRQQMAAILYRYHSWAGNTPVPGGSLSAYRDAADVAPWALEAMSWANTSGLIQGTGPNTLAPNGTATRAQVAVILTGYTKQTQK